MNLIQGIQRRGVVAIFAIVLNLFAFTYLLGDNLAEPQTSGISWFASPNGSGTTCGQVMPCTLNTALHQASAGDTVILLDGTYAQTVKTVKAGSNGRPITIRALNRRQATIRPKSNGACIDIRHSYVTVRGLVVDGQGSWCRDGIRIFGSKGPPEVFLAGVIVEHNRITNLGGKYMFIGASDGFIIRWNDMDGGSGKNVALGDTCSGIYLGSYDGSSAAINGQIYANSIHDAQCEGVDIKSASENNEIHHNIFDDIGAGTSYGLSSSGSPNTGVITFRSFNNRAHSNIVKRYKVRKYGGCVTGFDSGSGNRFDHNVCRDSLSPSIAIGANADAHTSNHGLQIDSNTFCDLVSYKISVNATSFIILKNTGLLALVSSAMCATEEARILAEREFLPGNPNTP
jgi:hypothetical protein